MQQQVLTTFEKNYHLMENLQHQVIIPDSIRTNYIATTKQFSKQDLPPQMWHQSGPAQRVHYLEKQIDVMLFITLSANHNPNYKLWVLEISPSTDDSCYFLWCEKGLSVECFRFSDFGSQALDGDETIEITFAKPIG